jgi:mRNA-degrading endonuclease YafQ of YafQ-DinJ toxin-antitoxin module
MIEIKFKPSFIKKFDVLEKELQEEVLEKIELFKDSKNHEQLKVHKLHGQLKENHSFSVNYKFRIVFNYISKKEVVFLTIGDHEVYK